MDTAGLNDLNQAITAQCCIVGEQVWKTSLINTKRYWCPALPYHCPLHTPDLSLLNLTNTTGIQTKGLVFCYSAILCKTLKPKIIYRDGRMLFNHETRTLHCIWICPEVSYTCCRKWLEWSSLHLSSSIEERCNHRSGLLRFYHLSLGSVIPMAIFLDKFLMKRRKFVSIQASVNMEKEIIAPIELMQIGHPWTKLLMKPLLKSLSFYSGEAARYMFQCATWTTQRKPLRFGQWMGIHLHSNGLSTPYVISAYRLY